MPALNNELKKFSLLKLIFVVFALIVFTAPVLSNAAVEKKSTTTKKTSKATKATAKKPVKKVAKKPVGKSTKARSAAKKAAPAAAAVAATKAATTEEDGTAENSTPTVTHVPSNFVSAARQAFLIDYNTNTVLYDKNATQVAGPASMTKVLTAYIVFDYLKNNKVKLTDKFCTSRYASTRGGTKMFLKEGQCTELQYLLYGLLVMSGNDAAMTIAEGIGGSEPEFIAIMNQYAKKLGMTQSHFANPNGLPNPDHYSSAHDLVVLAKHVIDDFPEYYPFFSKKVFEYNGIIQPNRNKLLNEGLGVDGLKTGFTVASGYGMIVSAERDGRRIIGVVNGNPTAKKRLEEARKLVAFGFDHFEIVKLFEKNKTIDKMRIWGGETDYVNLYSAQDIQFVVRKATKATAKYRTEIMFKEPWKAPIKAGTHAANLAIYENDKLRATYPLYTSTDVKQGTFVESIVDKIKLLSDDKQQPKKQ